MSRGQPRPRWRSSSPDRPDHRRQTHPPRPDTIAGLFRTLLCDDTTTAHRHQRRCALQWHSQAVHESRPKRLSYLHNGNQPISRRPARRRRGLDKVDEPATYVTMRRLPCREAKPIHVRKCRLMDQDITAVGLDVLKASLVATILPRAAARPTDTVTIQNCPKATERLLRRVPGHGRVVFVHEASPCGYRVPRLRAAREALHRFLCVRELQPTGSVERALQHPRRHSLPTL